MIAAMRRPFTRAERHCCIDLFSVLCFSARASQKKVNVQFVFFFFFGKALTEEFGY